MLSWANNYFSLLIHAGSAEIFSQWPQVHLSKDCGQVHKHRLDGQQGLVDFKMKITPWFTHPKAILGVYDFLLSDEHNQSYINKYPEASKLYNGS